MSAMSLDKFKDLPRDQQVAIHEEMKQNMGIEGILKMWDLTRSKYYYMVRKLKLNQNTEEQPQEKSETAQNQTSKISSLDFEESPIPLSQDATEQTPYSLSIQGSPVLVGAMMKSLEDMIRTSNSNYSVNITIKEC